MRAILIAAFGGGGLTALLNWLVQRNQARARAQEQVTTARLDAARWTWQEAQDIVGRYKDDIAVLRQELASVRMEVGELKRENQTLRQEKVILQREVDALTAEVGRLRAEVQTLKGGG